MQHTWRTSQAGNVLDVGIWKPQGSWDISTQRGEQEDSNTELMVGGLTAEETPGNQQRWAPKNTSETSEGREPPLLPPPDCRRPGGPSQARNVQTVLRVRAAGQETQDGLKSAWSPRRRSGNTEGSGEVDEGKSVRKNDLAVSAEC